MAFPDGRNPCSKCEQGYTDIYRLVVRSNAYGGQKYLIHAHRHENLQHILLRVCEQYPSEWTKDTVYYFYLDIGGAYYAVEHAFWLRDKDQVLITTVSNLNELPDISMNAVHASLRPNVHLQPHQEEGIQRMITMERSQRGGILADDMGLGKTLQMLSLIMRQQSKLNMRSCTLVVVPSRGVADQWAEEIRTKTTYGSIPYFIYNEETVGLLEQPVFRVVITTYDRLRAEYRNRQISGMAAPLIDMEWFRVVLDESHKVRSMKTLVTESVLELQARYRWCITGTPLQNDISELHPIFAFLQINIPLKQRQNVDYISTVLKQHMVRRTKKSLQTALTILPQRENRVELQFTDAERALYDYLERVLYKQIQNWRRNGHAENARTASSLLYLRLKQTCGHYQILLSKFPNLIPMVQSGQENTLVETLNTDDRTPAERSTAQDEDTELNEVMDVIGDYYEQFGDENELPDMGALQKLPFIGHSTKVAWLIRFLKGTLQRSVSDKIVVVTQFVDLLLVISNVLTTINIRHSSYHGDMSSTARSVSLRQFNHMAEYRVMLLSLKAGGIGLNLQRANHMVILDRWWNPATMDQAIARIHRMTQLKQTFIHTVVIKDTIEEGLLDNVLAKKSALFKTVVEEEDDFAALVDDDF
ncbi:hypothetical protein VTP01DRAFT_4449 [Rhizomucor pusillus]|uniref:uncharacterized protein n=1 Tax=Rhizomucor pusillus TaxID=4840 RepID=UPI0037449B74